MLVPKPNSAFQSPGTHNAGRSPTRVEVAVLMPVTLTPVP